MITKNSVVELHYRLNHASGEPIESTFDGGEPVLYLHGNEQMIPGFESRMEGHVAGDEFEFTLTAEEAYGLRQDNAVVRVPVKHLQGAKRWKPGMLAVVNTNQGNRQVTVLKVGKFMADVDSNHPLAGKDLTFAVKVVSVREATAEEVSHGHAHAGGSCGH
ncbi:FKBP-type peptidyl-prolyl cis-trans isomerase [Parathalassolituus penaei]|uniref:Peptidyl-prolyl cis-trans isomerase n=1 Tax=Parathalassolituus penaei TaxID=2997323 RepID=A0A9X3EET8_9GAMM|nr:peptidylprolyl isomerase [Parathalassolituus penaei]MCY0966224.1 peptidylprolyl isomerase [Parathalassolituus penaei]